MSYSNLLPQTESEFWKMFKKIRAGCQMDEDSEVLAGVMFLKSLENKEADLAGLCQEWNENSPFAKRGEFAVWA